MTRLALFALMFALVPARAANPVPEKLRDELKLDKFYQKHVDAGGLPVVGSEKVSDHALAEAAWIVGKMLNGREDILKAMRANKVRVVVMAATEFTTDVPEHSKLTPKQYWDRRARGLGATRQNPCVSCGEENLLGFGGDPYPRENIFVHEFAHAIHGTGLSTADKTFDQRLRAAYDAAKERGLWKNTYAATNHSEYWAEGVQCWFDDNAPPDASHNDIRTRAQLKDYDPELAKLCKEVFGDGEWKYKRPAERKAEDVKHLPGYDTKKLPQFKWREAPVTDKPKVVFETAAGDFVIELDAKASPQATALFLRVALEGGYHSTRFARAGGNGVTAFPNLKWFKAHPNVKGLLGPESDAKPVEGTVALLPRSTAFVVFAGAPGKGAPEGVIPFGRVASGANVVNKLLAAETDTDIRRAIRTE
jgi:hypothetical protein